jgi:hypothetical protein
MSTQAITHLAALFVLYMTISHVNCHMEMKSPPPRRSSFNPYVSEPQKDYNMVAPLFADGSQLPCKRYPAADVVTTYQAGQTINVQMSGTVFHEGGHCQFSISYDDQTFVVLRTVMDNCFVGTGINFAVELPATTPACDRCTFAWSWVNAVGNRELYMNCADVRVINTSQDPQFVIGKNYTVANMPGYPTIPEFPPSSYHGADLYANQGFVTVQGSSTTSAPVTSSSPSQTTTTQAPATSTSAITTTAAPTTLADTTTTVPTTTTVAPTTKAPTTAATTTTTQAPTTAGCVENSSKCGSGATWSLCSNGIYYTRPCPPGTVCSDSSGVAQCILAPVTGALTCINNDRKCISASQFSLCSNNVLYNMPCPAGTSCVMNNGQADCT